MLGTASFVWINCVYQLGAIFLHILWGDIVSFFHLFWGLVNEQLVCVGRLSILCASAILFMFRVFYKFFSFFCLCICCFLCLELLSFFLCLTYSYLSLKTFNITVTSKKPFVNFSNSLSDPSLGSHSPPPHLYLFYKHCCHDFFSLSV